MSLTQPWPPVPAKPANLLNAIQALLLPHFYTLSPTHQSTLLANLRHLLLMLEQEREAPDVATSALASFLSRPDVMRTSETGTCGRCGRIVRHHRSGTPFGHRCPHGARCAVETNGVPACGTCRVIGKALG
jgi:hypothetical protein